MLNLDKKHTKTPPIGKWINIFIQSIKEADCDAEWGEILRAQYLRGDKNYEGWYVKPDDSTPGKIYSQNELNVYSYTNDENDYDQWYKFHSIEEDRKYMNKIIKEEE